MTQRTSHFTIFGKDIPYYGMLFMCGLLLGATLAALRSKRRGMVRMDVVMAACFTAIGGVLGAKLLSVLTSIKTIIENDLSFWHVLRNGFVFYGGLIGGGVGLLIYCLVYKQDPLPYCDAFAVSVPLGHALGRVGCFLSGCCYGKPYDGPLAVIYEPTVEGNPPFGVKLLPIQLIEAFCLVLLYVALEITYFKTKKKGLPFSLYVLSYAVIRFVLEFFRGDKVRGIHGGLSTSQWISLALVIGWILLFGFFLYRKKKLASAPVLAEEGEGDAGAADPTEEKADDSQDALPTPPASEDSEEKDPE